MKKGFDYIGVTICFYCYDGKGKLLLQKRSKNCSDEQGRWDCGGAAVRFGETFERAVKRELKEEYCIDISNNNIQFCGVNNVLRKHNGKQTHWIAVVFGCLVDPKKVRIGDPVKMADIGWFYPNKLPKPLHSMYLTHLEFVKKASIL